MNKRTSHPWLYDFLLIVVLLAGAYLRLIGLDWDQMTHLHPDERFLTMVESSLQPVKTFSEYFDTAKSTLNPNNRGYGFFVYGTLPIFIVRYVADWMHMTGYDEVHLVGRAASALADLGAVFLLYVVASRLYGRRTGLLAAAFSALAVMQIQQSHFFTVDNFVTLFAMLTAFFAVEIMQDDGREVISLDNPLSVLGSGLFLNSLGFGLALGMAVASKINAAPIAILLPGAFIIRYFRLRDLPETVEEETIVEDETIDEMAAPVNVDEVFLAETDQLVPSDAFALEGDESAAEPAPVPEEKPRPRASISRTVELAILMVILGAFASLIAFRLFQPYAFSGPGFFGVKPNDAWVQGIMEQRAQAGGDVDFPPALQWARRSKLFGLENLVIWGLGWPLGILAWAGFAFMAWRMFKGEWKEHLLLWGWTGLYFAWQSTQFNPNLRYFLPIYPLLAMMAAWLVVKVAEKRPEEVNINWRAVFSWVVGIAVLAATAGWAYAFTRIYTRDHTRVQATEWIYQNIPGPINVRIAQPDGETFSQPIPFAYDYTLVQDLPFETSFHANASGQLSEVYLPHVRIATPKQLLQVTIFQDGLPLANAMLEGDFSVPAGISPVFLLQPQVALTSGQNYIISLTLLDSASPVDVCGEMALNYQIFDGPAQQVVDVPTCVLQPGQNVQFAFRADSDAMLVSISPARVLVQSAQHNETRLTVTLIDRSTAQTVTAQASVTDTFTSAADPRGAGYTLKLDQPVRVMEDETYAIRLDVEGNPLSVSHIAPINESSWDDGLPLRIGYDGYGGIYEGGQNLELYWDDNADKLARFESTLDKGDYIFITSNRQWATTVRVPERYPLTSVYYRNLIGCPEGQDVIWCYNVARPGQFTGNLGYELVKVFESYPTLGPLEFNDQFAEESFTVYDHTKVLIFKKTADYDPKKVSSILEAVDLSHVIHLTPRKASSFPGDLTLSPEKLAVQRAGGTWSELFSYDAFQNKYPVLGLVIWYLAIGLLGLFAYPLVRLLLPGLQDKGYPLARLAGLLFLSYFAWIVGSLGGAYSRGTIAAGYGLIMLAGAVAFWFQREAIREEAQSKGRYFLIIEALFFALFLIDLLIRIGNPDLWHASKGGERPMDFSYLNAILRSTTFPAYDPWYAGGYINYYYWGFVLVGTPIKLLGLVPSIAYNFVLPTLFAMVGMGGFSVAWNLVGSFKPKSIEFIPDEMPEPAPELATEPVDAVSDQPSEDILLDAEGTPHRVETLAPLSLFNLQLIAGFAASIGLVLIGNLGTIRMIFRGLQKMAVPYEMVDSTSVWFYERWAWAAQGVVKLFSGQPLPYGWGEWYWQPSRVIPAPGEVEPITEFPLFTFLYSDLHAHMIVLPLTLLVIAWALSTLMARNINRWQWLGSLAFGGLAIGVLRPTNTWDFPTYLALAALVTGYSMFRYADVGDSPRFGLSPLLQRLLLAAASMAALAAFAVIFFEPFARWYGLGYSQVELWKGTHTPIWSYWTHWGLFLFFIIAWMSWETRQWLAQTPLSALSRLKPYELFIELAVGALVVAIIVLITMFKVSIAWFALPLAFWALVLLLRPDLPDAKRLVLFMIGTGLFLTIVVEIIVLVGDISRMNTVFKFYLQVWTMFAISAAASIAWVWADMDEWTPAWRNFWQVGASLLVLGAFAFTFTATMDKIRDRISPDTPLTLDSMEYMKHSTYWDGIEMDLSQDYAAIRWLQDNVQGSPVTVEASIPEYRWGTRYTIYTGLPTVLGWNWHQRQQRALLPGEWVFQRSEEIKNFYLTTDPETARRFLQKYDVRYILLGQVEQHYFDGPGLNKFDYYEGSLWREVFHTGETTIYEVLP